MTHCERFDRWLDEGRLAGDDATMRAHARACPRCARLLEAEAAIDSLLGAPPTPAPPRFTDAVMREIAHERATRLAAAGAPRELLPWWVQIAAEPRVAGALVVAALVVWQGEDLRAWASSAAVSLASAASAWTAAAAPADNLQLYGLYVWLGAGVTWGSLALVRAFSRGPVPWGRPGPSGARLPH
jgi:hypothetical protein